MRRSSILSLVVLVVLLVVSACEPAPVGVDATHAPTVLPSAAPIDDGY